MSYRFVKVTSYNNKFLEEYYSRNPDIVTKSYQEQMSHIMGEAFQWADFTKTHLEKIGVDAYEIIANAVPMQRAWARENGVEISGKKLVAKQIEALKPDVVMFQDSITFNGAFITFLKENIPSIKQIIGYHGVALTKDLLIKFRPFDYFITCSPAFTPILERAGIRSYRIYHSFDESLLNRIKYNNDYPNLDLIFIGSLITAEGYHNDRINIVRALLEEGIDLQVYSELQETALLLSLARQGAYCGAKVLKIMGLEDITNNLPGLRRAMAWKKIPKIPRYPDIIKSVIHAPLYGLAMLKALSRAKIGFNIHIDAAGEYAANMRLFEVTGVGTCLLTDWKKNIEELFEPDKEIVTYSSLEECSEKVKWLRNNPKACKEIAEAGQARCLRDHTFAQRVLELDEIIRKEFCR